MKYFIMLALVMLLLAPTAYAQRTTDRLTALYDFNEGTGEYITGIGPTLQLSTTNRDSISWVDGGLLIKRPVTIESIDPTSNITTGIIASNEFTLEAWIRNTTITATGPARIISLSESDFAGGNFMMGQDNRGLVVRCLTTNSDQYGNPPFNASMLFTNTNELRHVVYTRNTNGDINVYVNGILIGTTSNTGQLSSWGDHTLTLASESLDDGQRGWVGELRLVAIYTKALTPTEVLNNYNAGESDIIPPVIPGYNPLVDAIGEWDAPLNGTPVVRYVVQLSINNGSWYDYALTEQTTVNVRITFFDGHRIRVAGIDANNRQGQYSEPSNIYVPANTRPHPPTKPIRQ